MASIATSPTAPRRDGPRDTTWRYTGAVCRDVDPLRIGAFVKTQMCRFHLKGICCKGENCTYAHTEAELQPAPDLAKTKRCRTLILKGVCKNPDCTYAHGREELVGTTSEVRRSRGMCKFWVKGTCTLGDRCTHAHEELEQTRTGMKTSGKQSEIETIGTKPPRREFVCEDFFDKNTVPVLNDSWVEQASPLQIGDLGALLLNLAETEYDHWPDSSYFVAGDEREGKEENLEKDQQEQVASVEDMFFAPPPGLPQPQEEQVASAEALWPMHLAPPPGLPQPLDVPVPEAAFRRDSGHVLAVLNTGDKEAPCHLAWTDIDGESAEAKHQETQKTSWLTSAELDALDVLHCVSAGKPPHVGEVEASSTDTASGAGSSWVRGSQSESGAESVHSVN